MRGGVFSVVLVVFNTVVWVCDVYEYVNSTSPDSRRHDPWFSEIRNQNQECVLLICDTHVEDIIIGLLL